jgi:hypothetical protein
MSTNKQKQLPEVIEGQQLQMLAELCQLQGKILKSMIQNGYVPTNLNALLEYTEGIGLVASSLTSLMQDHTQILLLKHELGNL